MIGLKKFIHNGLKSQNYLEIEILCSFKFKDIQKNLDYMDRILFIQSLPFKIVNQSKSIFYQKIQFIL